MLQVICLTNEAKETLDAPVLKIATLYTHTHTHTHNPSMKLRRDKSTCLLSQAISKWIMPKEGAIFTYLFNL